MSVKNRRRRVKRDLPPGVTNVEAGAVATVNPTAGFVPPKEEKSLERILKAIPGLASRFSYAGLSIIGALALLVLAYRSEFPSGCKGVGCSEVNQPVGWQIIKGEVVTLPDHRPMPDILLDVYYSMHNLLIHVKTDELGRYAYPAMSGPVYVVPHLQGYAYRIGGTDSGFVSIQVRPETANGMTPQQPHDMKGPKSLR